jgi:bacterioferritin
VTAVPEVPIGADNRQMLENALAAEVDTIRRYTLRIQQAEEAGELSVKIQLEDLIVDESHHRDDIRRILKDWR